MSNKYEWRGLIKDKSGKVLEEVHDVYTLEEWTTFQDYESYAVDLFQLRLFREGAPGRLDMKWDQQRGFSFETDIPDDEMIMTLLHKLRPFILNNESTNFGKVSNIIARRTESDQIRRFIKEQKEYYLGKKIQGMVKVLSNEVLLNSEEILQKWLNAHEYHKEKDKQVELECLLTVLPMQGMKAIFIMMLYDKAHAIRGIWAVIRTILGKQDHYKSY